MILNSISNPEDLKKISKKYLPEVCVSIRKLIIDTCSKNGGHLAPSLGVVELTTALHYVFDSPNDKIIWDVGHQSYAHKILTGRREKFHTLRQEGGLSGFPKISESSHDPYGTGHSSTSISAAIGIAHALEKEGSGNRAIAIIGDGSMTGGLAFEALNQAGHKVGNLVVILNDNEMSISPNVGALSKFLSINLHSKTVSRIRRCVKKVVLHIPIWGKRIYKFMEKAEETTVGFFTPGYLFEAFGCNYIGPLDGHNLEELTRVFKDIKDTPIGNRPILIHVITKKGKGYAPAEEDPTRFHGVGPFCRDTGFNLSKSSLTFTKAFSNTMLELAKSNPKLIGITAAMSEGTGLAAFAKEYPDRFFDVGIAEGHAVTFAAGLATQGFRPIVGIYSTFLQRAYDHIIHDVCLQNLPITFALDRAGVVGEDGPTHHGTFDLSYLRLIPNMVLMAPRDETMLYKMFDFGTKYNGVVAIRYPRGKIPEKRANSEEGYLELGKAEIVYEKPNSQAIILAVGHLVSDAVLAAEFLWKEGVGVTVVDPRFVKPFDFNLLENLVKTCPNIVTVEENALPGGFGSMISEWICNNNLMNFYLKSLAIPDKFVQHASQQRLREICGLDVEGIVKAVREIPNESADQTLISDEKIKVVSSISRIGQ